ncbi:MAG: hypothetical protein PVJ98_10270 [Akkermansiaceae bacterium]|jgi:hypothetical protein
MSTAKKKAAKPKPEILLSCTVLQDHTKIGAMLCLKGTRASLPEAKAKALEKLGKVRIDGVA